MKRYNWLIPISMTMMVLACDPSKEDPKPDTSVGGDVASDIATDLRGTGDTGGTDHSADHLAVGGRAIFAPALARCGARGSACRTCAG